jgi:hypothetical protein
MTFDPTTNRITWGLLTAAEKTVLKGCGGPWETYVRGSVWMEIKPDWDNSLVYRQATPAIIPASVDWSCFGPDIVVVAADYVGEVFAFKQQPQPNKTDWYGPGFPIRVTGNFPPHAYVRGTDIWQNSLVVRP